MAFVLGCDHTEDHDGDGFVNCDEVVRNWPRYHDPFGCLEGEQDLHTTLDGQTMTLEPYGGFNLAVHDCNDGDPALNPDALEVCDGVDNNCNGLWDEGEDANDLENDCDGDGYVKLGFMDASDDCDPWDAAVNHDALEVIDGKDNDCDGDCLPEECSYDADSSCPCRGDTIDVTPLIDPGCQCGVTGSLPLSAFMLTLLAGLCLRRRI